MDGYARKRDAAFAAFVADGDFAHIDALMDEYGLPRIPHTPAGAAGVYKAVRECRGIPGDVKARAALKCMELGYSPTMR